MPDDISVVTSERVRVKSNSILFFNMPWAPVLLPPIGLGILKSIALSKGFGAIVENLNLRLFREIDPQIYEAISHEQIKNDRKITIDSSALFGEMLFSSLLFEFDDEKRSRYIEFVEGNGLVTGFNASEIFDYLRQHCEEFVEAVLSEYDWHSVGLVGFTSTFEQTCPSLLLAREIKKQNKDIKVLFGGANCESTMGQTIADEFDQVDFVFSGEAETTFSLFLDTLCVETAEQQQVSDLEVECITKLNGFISSRSVEISDVPIPDYDDYFEYLDSYNMWDSISPSLQVESSRGCWWGNKHHCKFCGLNGANMKYRSRQPYDVINEMISQGEKYGINKYSFVDNIMDMTYIGEFTDEISSLDKGWEIFFEVKSNLNREHLRKLSEAGICHVQPGIENFSSNLLMLMNKGVAGIQNVAFIKWCKIYGIRPQYNIITGFPGESLEDYLVNRKVLQSIVHLPQPVSVGDLRLDRFSPYFETDDCALFQNVRSPQAYEHVFPLERRKLESICYYFDYDLPWTEEVEFGYDKLLESVEQREAVSTPGDLFIRRKFGGGAKLIDTRFNRINSDYELNADEASLYDYCDAPRTVPQILSFASKLGMGDYSDETKIRSFLEELSKGRVMLNLDNKWLALGVPQIPANSFSK